MKKGKIVTLMTAAWMMCHLSGYAAMAADLQGDIYINEVFSQNVYDTWGTDYTEPYETWQSFLDAEVQTDDYLGVPYNASLYAASPRCDAWQGYVGTNCTGFVWHIISNGLVNGLQNDKGITTNIQSTCRWVPNVRGFNSMGFSRKCWNGGGWWTFINSNQIHYYEFVGSNAKEEMLSSGVLHKGDIIWCVDPNVGSGYKGLSIPANYHHIGIYMGDGYSDVWWHSGVSSGAPNSISQITGVVNPCTYVVVPWSAVSIENPVMVYQTGDVNGDEAVGVEDAVAVLEYYAKNTAGLTPNFADDENQNAAVIEAADVNEDGMVSIDDAVYILTYYAKSSAGLQPDWETVISSDINP